MIKWTESANISIPPWVISCQSEFQSRLYTDETARMDFVLFAAATNIGGHEMTNALVTASNILGSQDLRNSSFWSLYSLAPPCFVCLGNISNEKPYEFVCAVNHEDLLAALRLPNILMPEHGWINILESRGIIVKSAFARERGKKILEQPTD